jgi:hypothetical protein
MGHRDPLSRGSRFADFPGDVVALQMTKTICSGHDEIAG